MTTRNISLALTLDDLDRLIRYTNRSVSHIGSTISPRLKSPHRAKRIALLEQVERLQRELTAARQNYL